MASWPLGIMCLLCSGALWIIAAITWSRNAIESLSHLTIVVFF